jgi:hypothetical protein
LWEDPPIDVDPDPLPEDPPPAFPDGPALPDDEPLLAGCGEVAGVVWTGVVTAVADADGGDACAAAA